MRMSEKEVEMQTLIDRDLSDAEDFRVCNSCKPGVDTRFVVTTDVMTTPKVWNILEGTFFKRI